MFVVANRNHAWLQDERERTLVEVHRDPFDFSHAVTVPVSVKQVEFLFSTSAYRATFGRGHWGT